MSAHVIMPVLVELVVLLVELVVLLVVEPPPVLPLVVEVELPVDPPAPSKSTSPRICVQAVEASASAEAPITITNEDLLFIRTYLARRRNRGR
jgi:hypothetical protein